MLYKIGLISTHGTGKTTLAYTIAGELKKRGFKVKPLGEIATLATESGIPINRNTTLAAQAWILHKQCLMELEADIQHYEIAVCDRTVIDNYVYMENALGRKEQYLQAALDHMKANPYNRIYLIPITHEPVADGIRDSNSDFQWDIHQKLIALLHEFRIDFVELPPPPKEDTFRAEWVNIIVQQTVKDSGRKTMAEFM